MSRPAAPSSLSWRLSGLRLTPEQALAEPEQLHLAAVQALGCKPDDLLKLRICKKSLDAREPGRPVFVYTVDLDFALPVAGRVKGRGLRLTPVPQPAAAPPPPRPSLRLPLPPVIVGAGPAGLFAALALAAAGYAPLLLEQGRPVEQRHADVAAFWQRGELNPQSNVQFGEGGAGTFSDGKLTARGKDPLAAQVLAALVEAGAPAEISYSNKPHLGSDLLLELLPRLRQRICALGGRIIFGTQLSGLVLDHRRRLVGLKLAGGPVEEIAAQQLILATGNGAYVTYQLLERAGVALAAKPFAVGLRIEHDQALIDQAQYGGAAGHMPLPSADYHLTFRDAAGRSFYSFCMCPGGRIVNAASAPHALVTNGISLAARASGRANSALVGAVSPGVDFPDAPMAALAWQQALEKAAFAAGGGDYALPVCLAEDFLCGWGAQAPPVEFQPLSIGWRAAELRPLLPEPLAVGLAAALEHWQRQIPGFAAGAVLAGLETRTSAPLRILRGPGLESINTPGLYPAGEGAGYAGGIISSAVDGLRIALALQEAYLPAAEDFPAAVINSLGPA